MPLEMLIAVAVFAAVAALGLLWQWLRQSRRKPLLRRLGAPAPPPVPGDEGEDGLVRTVESIGRKVSPHGSSKLREDMAKAGYYSDQAATVYMGAKIVMLAVGLAATAALIMPLPFPMHIRLMLVLLLSASMFFLPNWWVRLRRLQRTDQVRTNLPDAVDLLEICVSAGIGMDMAWIMVTDEIRCVSGMLADEMALTSLEISLGSPRVQALRNMAARTGADELSSLVAVLVQSDKFGTSVADALRSFAVSMREHRSLHAEEVAERMAVKMLFPMILCIFPVVLLVVAGPAGMTLARLLTAN